MRESICQGTRLGGGGRSIWYAVTDGPEPLVPGVGGQPALLWRLDVDHAGRLTSGRVRRTLVHVDPDPEPGDGLLCGRAAANLMLQGGVGLVSTPGGDVAFGPGIGLPPKRADVIHPAVGAPYAPVTEPLRRPTDRLAAEVAWAVSNQVDVPAWALDGLRRIAARREAEPA